MLIEEEKHMHACMVSGKGRGRNGMQGQLSQVNCAHIYLWPERGGWAMPPHSRPAQHH